MEAFKHRVKIEMEINLVRRWSWRKRVFHGRERSVHVRKLNKKKKKAEETYEGETYYLLTKKSRKLKKRRTVGKQEDTEDKSRSFLKKWVKREICVCVEWRGRTNVCIIPK